MLRRYYVWCLIAGMFFTLSVNVYAQILQSPAEQTSSPKCKLPEFTQIQDLNPNTTSANQPMRQKWAVVIGISKFKDSSLNNNSSNERAARDFQKYLVDPQYGRFSPDHVRLLTNETASQQNILSSLGPAWLGAAAGKDDLVVVFVATNGFPTTEGETYLCSYNCALDNVYSTCVSMRGLMQQLKNNVKADRVVLVLQSCYSGSAELSDLSSGAKSIGSKLSRTYNVDLDKLMLGKGYVILSSSKPDQLTLGDAFSANLISALKQKDGLIPLREAFAKASEGTEYDTTFKQYPPKTQTPVMKSEWKGNDLVIGTPPLDKVSNLPDSISTFLGAESHYLNASKAASEGRLDDAIAEYKAAIAADSTYADAVADYGAALAIQGHWSEATNQLHKAVALRPDDVLYRTNYARALDQTGNSTGCVKQLEYAYSINPRDSSVLKALASKSLAVGDTATAQRMLNEAIELYPKSAVLYDKLAYAEIVGGKLDEALLHAKTALKIDPQLTSAQLNLASILASKGDVTQAIGTLRAALNQNPNSADAWYLMGQAMQKSGDKTGEVDALSNFLSNCSSADRRADDTRKRLADLKAQQTATTGKQ